MKVLPIAYQKQWGVNYSINDKRRDFMSDNNKKVEEKAAEIIQATETQTVKPAAAEDKEFKKKKSTTWERNQRKWGWAFILPTMIGIIVLNLWPIVQTIYQSFCKVGSFGDSSFAGFANYKKMFADPEVWQSLLNTFKYAIIEVPFSIAIALILAVFLNRKMHGRTIYRAIFFLPMVVAPAAVAMVWRWLYNSQFGLLNHILGAKIEWISNPKIAWISVAIIGVWSIIGYNMVLFLAGLQEIPKDYYEAADIDGASGVRSFFKITLPMISPTILFTSVVASIASFKIFDSVNVMTQGGPVDSTNTLVYYIYSFAFRYGKPGMACAAGVILLILVCIMTYVQFGVGKKRVHYQ